MQQIILDVKPRVLVENPQVTRHGQRIGYTRYNISDYRGGSQSQKHISKRQYGNISEGGCDIRQLHLAKGMDAIAYRKIYRPKEQLYQGYPDERYHIFRNIAQPQLNQNLGFDKNRQANK